MFRLIIFLLVTASFATASPKIIAHRGASALAPENTLAAFELAWKLGADGIEGDFRLSSDGKIVCIHDEDTKRTAGKKLTVSKTPYSRLSKLDVGSWKDGKYSDERMPLLSDVLAIVPEDKYFFLEVKCGPEIVPHLKEALTQAHRQNTIIISFEPEVIKACGSELPGFQTHLLTRLKNFHRKGQPDKELELLKDISASGIQFKHDAPMNASFITRLRSRGLLSASWTVDHPQRAVALAMMGVDFITTNRPGALGEHFRNHTTIPSKN